MADLAEDVTFEDAVLSKIPRQCDEPFLNQEGIKDDAKEEVVKETSNTACLFSWEFSFCRDRWKRFHKETCPTNEEASLTSNLSSARQIWVLKKKLRSPLKTKQRATWRSPRSLSTTILSDALQTKGLVEPAKRLAKKSSSPESKVTLSNLVTDKKVCSKRASRPRRDRVQTIERPVHRRLLRESRKNFFVDEQRRGRVLRHNDDRLQRSNSRCRSWRRGSQLGAHCWVRKW